MTTPVLRTAKSKARILEQLDSKQVLYVEARLNGSQPVAAARIAGYTDADQGAMDNETNSLIREAIRLHVRQEAYQKRLTRDDVLAGFLDAVNMAQTAAEMTGAWREIGKVIGAYEPQKVDLTIHGADAVKEMSDEKLLEMAAIDGEFEVLEFEEDSDDDDVR